MTKLLCFGICRCCLKFLILFIRVDSVTSSGVILTFCHVQLGSLHNLSVSKSVQGCIHKTFFSKYNMLVFTEHALINTVFVSFYM